MVKCAYELAFDKAWLIASKGSCWDLLFRQVWRMASIVSCSWKSGWSVLIYATWWRRHIISDDKNVWGFHERAFQRLEFTSNAIETIYISYLNGNQITDHLACFWDTWGQESWGNIMNLPHQRREKP